jgi:hypothetical protein
MYTSQRAHLVSADLHRYPMIDDRAACARTYILTSASSSGRKRTTISAGVSLYATAARAADVSGLPPTYVSVGGLDLFLEENMIYADRLSRAGVPVELHMYPRAYHGFYRVTNARVTSRPSTTIARRCDASCTDGPCTGSVSFRALSLSWQIEAGDPIEYLNRRVLTTTSMTGAVMPLVGAACCWRMSPYSRWSSAQAEWRDGVNRGGAAKVSFRNWFPEGAFASTMIFLWEGARA